MTVRVYCVIISAITCTNELFEAVRKSWNRSQETVNNWASNSTVRYRKTLLLFYAAYLMCLDLYTKICWKLIMTHLLWCYFQVSLLNSYIFISRCLWRGAFWFLLYCYIYILVTDAVHFNDFVWIFLDCHFFDDQIASVRQQLSCLLFHTVKFAV